MNKTFRGKIPTLISGSNGKVDVIKAGGKSHCKKCSSVINKDEQCFEINNTRKRGKRRFCKTCFKLILDQTKKDLESLYSNFVETSSI